MEVEDDNEVEVVEEEEDDNEVEVVEEEEEGDEDLSRGNVG